MHKMQKFHLNHVNSPLAMIDAMKMKRSIYFATLQGYVIFETELYVSIHRISIEGLSIMSTKHNKSQM